MINPLHIEDKYNVTKYDNKSLTLEQNVANDKTRRATEVIKAVKGALDEVKVSNEEKYYAMKERLELGFERKIEGLWMDKMDAENKLAKAEDKLSEVKGSLKKPMED